MPREMTKCEHCGGKKTCTTRSGKSCDECLRAAGRRHTDWATVRCSFCGGRGFVVVETDEQAADATEPESPAQEA